MDCVKFKQKTAIKRKSFVWEQKLCFNCLSKTHGLKEYQSEFRCRVDGCRQKHHTLLHKEPLDNQNDNSDYSLQVYIYKFYQLTLEIKMEKRLKTNALLDSRSDTTLISKAIKSCSKTTPPKFV